MINTIKISLIKYNNGTKHTQKKPRQERTNTDSCFTDLLIPRRPTNTALPLHIQKHCTTRRSSWGSSISITNNNQISIAPYGHNFRGAGGRLDQCSVKV